MRLKSIGFVTMEKYFGAIFSVTFKTINPTKVDQRFTGAANSPALSSEVMKLHAFINSGLSSAIGKGISFMPSDESIAEGSEPSDFCLLLGG